MNKANIQGATATPEQIYCISKVENQRLIDNNYPNRDKLLQIQPLTEWQTKPTKNMCVASTDPRPFILFLLLNQILSFV